MCEAVEEMKLDGVAVMIPAHSLLHRDIVLESSRVWCESEGIQTETPVREKLGTLFQRK